jgi:hypothetical protein
MYLGTCGMEVIAAMEEEEVELAGRRAKVVSVGKFPPRTTGGAEVGVREPSARHLGETRPYNRSAVVPSASVGAGPKVGTGVGIGDHGNKRISFSETFSKLRIYGSSTLSTPQLPGRWVRCEG